MRLALALIAIGCFATGCGDDTTTSSADLSVAHDMATGNAPTCAAYCAKIQMNCTAGSGDAGGNEQYADTTTCTNYCMSTAAWPAGNTGDTSGNTIGCRLYHAGAAAADPVTHCPHAGPTGGAVCGSYCENYCQLMAKNCTGANAIYDMTTCMTNCTSIPTNGHANDTSGNTVQCRIYHLGAAFSDPATHCPHSRIVTDPMFTGPCTGTPP